MFNHVIHRTYCTTWLAKPNWGLHQWENTLCDRKAYVKRPSIGPYHKQFGLVGIPKFGHLCLTFNGLMCKVLLQAVRTSQELNECGVFQNIGSALWVQSLIAIVSSFSKRKTGTGYHRRFPTADMTSKILLWMRNNKWKSDVVANGEG